MTTFEQELIEHMQKGCPYPKCGRHMFRLAHNIAVAEAHPSKELSIHSGAYIYVWCGNGHLLWTRERGWLDNDDLEGAKHE